MSFSSKRSFSNNDNFKTKTSLAQQKVEELVNEHYKKYLKNEKFNFGEIPILRKDHVICLLEGIQTLPKGFTSLDSSKPWLIYWIVHALDLLGSYDGETSKKFSSSIVKLLKKMQDKNGGFCGGTGQLPHLAPTYAAVNALCVIGTKEAYDCIDRKALYKFLIKRKDKESGGFTMHDDGEVDIRGAYCSLSVACLLNILTPELASGVTKYIVNCQTYEGGLSALPMREAHGGYAFCGLATLMILKKAHLLNIPMLIHWCCRRQMSFEGGFQGRTNKLVDSCYSFWMGGNFPLLNALLASMKQKITKKEEKYYKKLSWTPPKDTKQEIIVEKEVVVKKKR